MPVCEYEELLAAEPDSFDWPELDERSAAAMCYTSGTTGKPKGVVYSHRSSYLHSMGACLGNAFAISERDRVLPSCPCSTPTRGAWPTPACCPGGACSPRASSCGAAAPAGRETLMVAIDPKGHGDVSQTEVRYKRTKLLPYVPTPLAYQNYVFLWCDRGTVCCIDPTTGKDVWVKRIGGDFSGSPIGAGGMLFNMDEHGEVVVLAAGPEFKLLGKIPLGEPSHSTPAVADGRLYLRTFHHLTCVAARP